VSIRVISAVLGSFGEALFAYFLDLYSCHDTLAYLHRVFDGKQVIVNVSQTHLYILKQDKRILQTLELIRKILLKSYPGYFL